MARDDFSQKAKRILGNISNNKCMICYRSLVTPNYAHIIPASKNGPRGEYRTNYNEEFIKSVENGLCLCNECHNCIDDDSINQYTVDELFQINKMFQENFQVEHEYKQILGVYDVDSYHELKEGYERIILYLNQDLGCLDNYIADLSFDKIPYETKMEINKFDRRHQREVSFVYAEEFSSFQKMIENSPIIGIKLRAAVSTLYNRLENDTKDSNELVDKMLGIMHDPSESIVGNKIVLYYYFIICEVFKINDYPDKNDSNA